MTFLYKTVWSLLFFTITAYGQNIAPVTTANEKSEIQSHISIEKKEILKDFCAKVDLQYKKFNWGDPHCSKIDWSFSHKSEHGNPLVYWVFDSTPSNAPTNTTKDTTVLLGGVHGDEPSGVYVLLKFAAELYKNPDLGKNHRVIIAPLVNPDGFFAKTRANANSVDLNRNFPTKDWTKNAHALWKKRRWGNPQHFPGKEAGSEAGTLFQIFLLEKFNPDKLFSLHSPLDFVDYDGPGATKKKSALSSAEKKAQELALLFAKKTKNTRVVNYQFYPGSLGNYAGNERNIPTITLEFSSSNPKAAIKHWNDVTNALTAGVNFEFQRLTLATSAQTEKP
jgi:protein MpaA